MAADHEAAVRLACQLAKCMDQKQELDRVVLDFRAGPMEIMAVVAEFSSMFKVTKVNSKIGVALFNWPKICFDYALTDNGCNSGTCNRMHMCLQHLLDSCEAYNCIYNHHLLRGDCPASTSNFEFSDAWKNNDLLEEMGLVNWPPHVLKHFMLAVEFNMPITEDEPAGRIQFKELLQAMEFFPQDSSSRTSSPVSDQADANDLVALTANDVAASLMDDVDVSASPDSLGEPSAQSPVSLDTNGPGQSDGNVVDTQDGGDVHCQNDDSSDAVSLTDTPGLAASPIQCRDGRGDTMDVDHVTKRKAGGDYGLPSDGGSPNHSDRRSSKRCKKFLLDDDDENGPNDGACAVRSKRGSSAPSSQSRAMTSEVNRLESTNHANNPGVTSAAVGEIPCLAVPSTNLEGSSAIDDGLSSTRVRSHHAAGSETATHLKSSIQKKRRPKIPGRKRALLALIRKEIRYMFHKTAFEAIKGRIRAKTEGDIQVPVQTATNDDQTTAPAITVPENLSRDVAKEEKRISALGELSALLSSLEAAVSDASSGQASVINGSPAVSAAEEVVAELATVVVPDQVSIPLETPTVTITDVTDTQLPVGEVSQAIPLLIDLEGDDSSQMTETVVGVQPESASDANVGQLPCVDVESRAVEGSEGGQTSQGTEAGVTPQAEPTSHASGEQLSRIRVRPIADLMPVADPTTATVMDVDPGQPTASSNVHGESSTAVEPTVAVTDYCQQPGSATQPSLDTAQPIVNDGQDAGQPAVMDFQESTAAAQSTSSTDMGPTAGPSSCLQVVTGLLSDSAVTTGESTTGTQSNAPAVPSTATVPSPNPTTPTQGAGALSRHMHGPSSRKPNPVQRLSGILASLSAFSSYSVLNKEIDDGKWKTCVCGSYDGFKVRNFLQLMLLRLCRGPTELDPGWVSTTGFGGVNFAFARRVAYEYAIARRLRGGPPGEEVQFGHELIETMVDHLMSGQEEFVTNMRDGRVTFMENAGVDFVADGREIYLRILLHVASIRFCCREMHGSDVRLVQEKDVDNLLWRLSQYEAYVTRTCPFRIVIRRVDSDGRPNYVVKLKDVRSPQKTREAPKQSTATVSANSNSNATGSGQGASSWPCIEQQVGRMLQAVVSGATGSGQGSSTPSSLWQQINLKLQPSANLNPPARAGEDFGKQLALAWGKIAEANRREKSQVGNQTNSQGDSTAASQPVSGDGGQIPPIRLRPMADLVWGTAWPAPQAQQQQHKAAGQPESSVTTAPGPPLWRPTDLSGSDPGPSDQMSSLAITVSSNTQGRTVPEPVTSVGGARSVHDLAECYVRLTNILNARRLASRSNSNQTHPTDNQASNSGEGQNAAHESSHIAVRVTERAGMDQGPSGLTATSAANSADGQNGARVTSSGRRPSLHRPVLNPAPSRQIGNPSQGPPGWGTTSNGANEASNNPWRPVAPVRDLSRRHGDQDPKYPTVMNARERPLTSSVNLRYAEIQRRRRAAAGFGGELLNRPTSTTDPLTTLGHMVTSGQKRPQLPDTQRPANDRPTTSYPLPIPVLPSSTAAPHLYGASITFQPPPPPHLPPPPPPPPAPAPAPAPPSSLSDIFRQPLTSSASNAYIGMYGPYSRTTTSSTHFPAPTGPILNPPPNRSSVYWHPGSAAERRRILNRQIGLTPPDPMLGPPAGFVTGPNIASMAPMVPHFPYHRVVRRVERHKADFSVPAPDLAYSVLNWSLLEGGSNLRPVFSSWWPVLQRELLEQNVRDVRLPEVDLTELVQFAERFPESKIPELLEASPSASFDACHRLVIVGDAKFCLNPRRRFTNIVDLPEGDEVNQIHAWYFKKQPDTWEWQLLTGTYNGMTFGLGPSRKLEAVKAANPSPDTLVIFKSFGMPGSVVDLVNMKMRNERGEEFELKREEVEVAPKVKHEWIPMLLNGSPRSILVPVQFTMPFVNADLGGKIPHVVSHRVHVDEERRCNVRLVQVYMIQNPHRLKNFEDRAAELAHIYEPHSSEVTLERKILFHGTHPAAIAEICQDGFDWRRSGEAVGSKYGQGTYFSSSFDVSHKYSREVSPSETSPVQRGSRRFMFVAEVLVGLKELGRYALRYPSNWLNNVKYDTAVERLHNPEIFVKFDSTESYPKYLIEYEATPIPHSEGNPRVVAKEKKSS